MRLRRGAGTAAQDVLVRHEFAVVFAERSGQTCEIRGRAGRRWKSIPMRRRTFDSVWRSPMRPAAAMDENVPYSTKLPSIV